MNTRQKMVVITPKAHQALEALREQSLEHGVSLSKGAIASQLILSAKPEDVCKNSK